MFSTLRFSMLNSLGTRVVACLFNDGGKIEYEILFPDIGAKEAVRSSLSKADSDKLRRKLEKRGTLRLLREIECNAPSDDDTWSIEVDYGDDEVIRASGPDFRASQSFIILEDLAEVLDERFPILQLISPSRIDTLELEFTFNDMSEDYCGPDHTETLVLDREEGTLSYTKTFPKRCYHSSYECSCELQLRRILDDASQQLTSPELFEDIFADKEPMFLICITYHDGTYVQINRGLSREGLRDSCYFELLGDLFGMILELTFRDGMLDPRFLNVLGEDSL